MSWKLINIAAVPTPCTLWKERSICEWGFKTSAFQFNPVLLPCPPPRGSYLRFLERVYSVHVAENRAFVTIPSALPFLSPVLFETSLFFVEFGELNMTRALQNKKVLLKICEAR